MNDFAEKRMLMQYVIMDLEWNNTYAYKLNGFLNEIIEIGAVKLNESLEQIDTFSQVIKAQVGKKLRGSVKKLTNITNDDVKSGELFTKTFSDFKKWLGNEPTCIFTWGDGDIRVLVENYRYLNGIDHIPFLEYYCDLQACYHIATGTGKDKQEGLNSAALNLGINPDDYSLHRALGDSLLTAEVFKKIFSEELIKPHIRDCGGDFYKRLFFKAKVIKKLDNPVVNQSELYCVCEKCGKKCKAIEEWKYHNQFFRALCRCTGCDITYKAGVRFKVFYDHLDIKRIASVYDPSAEENGSDDEIKQGDTV